VVEEIASESMILIYEIECCHISEDRIILNTGRFIMFSLITNIYKKKTIGSTLVELFTATRKLKKVFFFDN